MKVRSKFGNELLKEFQIKIFHPGNEKSTIVRMRAPVGKGYSEGNVDEILEKTAAKVEEMYPGQDYQMVTIRRAQFNFVWRGASAAG